MAIVVNDNETIPANTTPSAGNSGGGGDTAYSNVANVGAMVSSTTAPAHGTQGLKIAASSAAVGFVGWNGYSVSSMTARAYVDLPSAPSSSSQILMQIRGSAAMANFVINTSGQLLIQDAAGGTAKLFGSVSAFYGTDLRLELSVTKGTTTSNGTITAAYYAGDSTTPIDSFTGTANQNTGTVNVTEVRIGKVSAAAYAGSGNLFFDDLAANDGTTTFIGPSYFATTGAAALTLTAAVTNALAFPVTASANLTLTGAASDSLTVGSAPTTGGASLTLTAAATTGSSATAASAAASLTLAAAAAVTPTTFSNNNDAIPAGATPSNANSGGIGNTPYTDVANVGNVTAITAGALSGSTSLSLPLTDTSVGFVGWSGLSLTTLGVRATFAIPSHAPTSSSYGVLQIRGAAMACQLSINTAGNLVLQDAASATKKTFTSFASYIGQTVDIELGCTKGTTTSNGTIFAAFYLQGSQTPIDTVTLTSQNAGTAALTDVRVGKFTSAAWGIAGSFVFDFPCYSITSLSVGPQPTSTPSTGAASLTLTAAAAPVLAFVTTGAAAVTLTGAAASAAAGAVNGAAAVTLTAAASCSLATQTAFDLVGDPAAGIDLKATATAVLTPPSVAVTGAAFFAFTATALGPPISANVVPLDARVRFTAPGFELNVSGLVADIEISRGRTSARETTIAAGTLTLTLDDTASTFDPDNTASPLHGHLDPPSSAVAPGATTTVRVDHYVTVLDEWFPLFTGSIESLERTFTGGDYSESTLVAVDQTGELTTHVPAKGLVLPMQTPNARIAQLLSTTSRSGFVWTTRAATPTPATALDIGQKILGTLTCDGTTASWDMCNTAAACEEGLLFINAAGTVTFQGQGHRLTTVPAWTLGDGAGQIPVESDLKYRYSTDDLITDASVVSTDGITSIYGPGGASSSTGAQATSTSQLSGFNAGAALARHQYRTQSKPRRNAPTLTLNATPAFGVWTSGGNPTAYQAAVSLEISDLVSVQRTPSGGGDVITSTYWIEGFKHKITAGLGWTVSLNVSRTDVLPVGGFWKLGRSKLHTGTKLTW